MLSLEQICLETLIKYKKHIGDVGSLPLHLLDAVLKVCTAEDLERIEEETRSGGRDVDQDELQIYWMGLYEKEFGRKPNSSQARQQIRHAEGGPGIWKDQYLAEKKELDEKMARVGRKVRGMWESEERKKQLRSIQVIEKVPQSKTRRPDTGRVLSSSSSSSTRARLAKKLRINPVTFRAPIPARAPLTDRRKVSGDKYIREPATNLRGYVSKAVPATEEHAEHGLGGKATILLDVDIDW